MSFEKRALDVVVAITALAIFAPALAIASILIWFEDGGTVLFRQVRIGRRRRPFAILKLRTMRNGVHVTRVGRWLRQTGIDEIPQFINVVRGDMSVVGPRPLTASDLQRLGWAEDDVRHTVRPGITGPAQTFGGRTAQESRELDHRYVKKVELLTDIKLISISFLMNVAGKGAVRRWLARHQIGREWSRSLNCR